MWFKFGKIRLPISINQPQNMTNKALIITKGVLEPKKKSPNLKWRMYLSFSILVTIVLISQICSSKNTIRNEDINNGFNSKTFFVKESKFVLSNTSLYILKNIDKPIIFAKSHVKLKRSDQNNLSLTNKNEEKQLHLSE